MDSSLAVEILLPTPLGVQVQDKIFREDRHAPHLIDIEFASALRRLLRLADIDSHIASRALETMRSWTIKRHEHHDLLPRVWELRDSVSAYDAAYVALAEALHAPLMTCDSKLARSHGHRANIVLVS